ncbi:MAG: hypothetical protein DRI57_22435 [Deltaproteobacteria bacterium]|nr:MAG: hypothetical protein DRI57_22435 [Deltaproteobacteria bacterium]
MTIVHEENSTKGNVQAYIDQLNQDQFTSYNDWRLPTLEELMSLLESERVNSHYIDPVFDRKQLSCWSADKRSSGGSWDISFDLGYVSFDLGDVGWHGISYVRLVRSRQY